MPNQEGFKVNTLIIGAGRSGTTSLFSYLESHKDICCSFVKEIHYFSIPELYGKGEKYYHSFFRKCNSTPVIASADTYLLMDHKAISRIYEYNPEMKLIVMLRDPVSRAYSSYNYSINYGHHQAYSAFTDSIDAEKNIPEEPDIVTRNNVGHFYGSLYYHHLMKWRASFPREQFLLLKTSDLRESPERLSEELFPFLGLSDSQGEIKRENVAAVPKNKRMERILMNRNSLLRKSVRNLNPRFLKNLIIRSGVVDRLHHANRKEQIVTPLSKEDIEISMPYFADDLIRLKKEFDIEF